MSVLQATLTLNQTLDPTFSVLTFKKICNFSKDLIVKKVLNFEISCKFARKKIKKYLCFKVFKFGVSMWDIFTNLVFRLRNSIMGLVIWLEVVLKFVRNVLNFCEK